jgi:hypothetical protein
VARLRTFSDLIELHIADMGEVGRAPGRSKDAMLRMLKRELGKLVGNAHGDDMQPLLGRGAVRRDRLADDLGFVTLTHYLIVAHEMTNVGNDRAELSPMRA